MNKFLVAVWETLQVAVIALVVVWMVRSFLIQPFIVEGSSMIPNFQDGDYLIVDELTYRLRSPERGETVVFKFTKNQSSYFIKRIIGLPKETVIIKEGQVSIVNSENPSGFILNEPYLIAATPGDIETVLGENEYFVLGDNRYMSYDSRNWGTLLKENIVGLTRFRLWPVNSAAAFSAPDYAQ